MTEVIISHESRRGCGYRKPAAGGVGIYLVGPATGSPCGRMPFPLTHCPTCNAGIKPSRGWNWITPRELFGEPWSYDGEVSAADFALKSGCKQAGSVICQKCPLGGAIPEGRHGLIWIGEAHYPKPEDFLLETVCMGLSRKIGALPKGFKLGETIVYLAHRKAIRIDAPSASEQAKLGTTSTLTATEPPPEFRPGIFATFKPSGVDLVIADENAVPEKAEKLAEKIGDGARIVRVIPKEGEQQSLPVVQEASP